MNNIENVIIKPLIYFEDNRGWLIELYRSDDISIEDLPQMSYISLTKPGLVRGPHEHKDQTDYFCFMGPSDFKLYLWDNREESNTYGNRMSLIVGESNPSIVIVPRGVVHGYKNIGKINGIVMNSPNRLYKGYKKEWMVDEIRHENNLSSPYKIDD